MNESPNSPRPPSARTEERERRRLSARRDRAEQALVENFMVQSKAQRLRLAENLWSIIKAAPSVTQAAALHEAGFGRKEDSTKRAVNYLCDPEWSEERKRKRVQSLTKKPLGYLSIARAVARLANADNQDTYLLDLVAGTSFGAEVESDIVLEDPQRDAWAALEKFIQKHAQEISRESGLPLYFSRQQGWGLTFRDGHFRSGGRQAEEPATFLGWVEVGGPRSGLFLFRDVDPRDSGFDCTPETIAEYKAIHAQNAYALKAYVHTILVLHLVLAPNGVGGAVVPSLRARCLTYVEAAEGSDRLMPFGGRPIHRGEVMAICHRGFAAPIVEDPYPLPACLVPTAQPRTSERQTKQREFLISERELRCNPMDFDFFGFDMASVEISDQVPGLPPSLVTDEEDEAPRVMMPIGEEPLSLLNLPLSRFMLERTHREAGGDASWEEAAKIITKLTFPLAEDWLKGDSETKARIKEISDVPGPYRSESSMLAALDRAFHSGGYTKDPYCMLRADARNLASELDIAIEEIEEKRSAKLWESGRG